MSGHLTNQSSHFLTTFPSSDCPLRLKAWTSQSMSSGKALGTLRRLTYIALFHVQSQEYSEYSFLFGWLNHACIYMDNQLQSEFLKIEVAGARSYFDFPIYFLKNRMEVPGFEPSALIIGNRNVWLLTL